MMHFLCILKTDLSRRMHKQYKTIYFQVSQWYMNQELIKVKKLFMIFISSAVTYFNKWGYFMIQKQ
jgi:hypothetical protein